MSKKFGFQNCRVIATGVNSGEYHKDNVARGKPEFKVSPSVMREFDHCAKRWIDGYELTEAWARRWGNLLDCLLLTPEHFDERYIVRPETYLHEKSGENRKWSANATDCKNWIADNIKAGMELLTPEEHTDARAAVEKLLADDIIKVFVESSDKQVLVEGEWHDEPTGLTIPVRCLIDLIPRNDTIFYKGLGDLKSTRSAALRAFQKDAISKGYHIQGAFNLDMYRAARPEEDRMNWCLLVQENYAPWTTGHRFSEDMPDQPTNFVHFGRKVYRRILGNYCYCLKTGVWPTYDDHDDACQGFSPLYVSLWDAEQEQTNRRFKEVAEKPTEEEQQAEENFDIH